MRRASLVVLAGLLAAGGSATPAAACMGTVCEVVCDTADLVLHRTTGHHLYCR